MYYKKIHLIWQCMPKRTNDAADDCINTNLNSNKFNFYFYLFLLGQTLHGFGATPLFSIGTAYIDENVSQKASPVYLGMCRRLFVHVYITHSLQQFIRW